MAKLWDGRFKKQLDGSVSDFNASIGVDCRMAEEDIAGSVVHAIMLGKTGILPETESKKIAKTLTEILDDLKSGKLVIDAAAEDIHSFVEAELTARIGDLGKKLHTARSRNDQVALDFRMYLKKEIDCIGGLLMQMIETITDVAAKNVKTVMPGYTHLQRAQPVTFAHHLLAYSAMFMRDYDRLMDAFKRTNVCPLGSGALAGTTYPIDRNLTAEMLGFSEPCFNSMDGVSDRDFCVETASAIALIMTHLSRLSEEIIFWSSWECMFIELDDAYSTGSSIMPQKKNPDIAELVRGKTGRVYGNLTALLTMLKGLPLAYNKDMQEDKELMFDSVDTVKACLSAAAPMLKTMQVNAQNMKAACQNGFINATDCADYLVKKGMPFRDAYKIVGNIVAYCAENKKTLEELELTEYKKYSDLFEQDVYGEISLDACVQKRSSFGGPSEQSVLKQIEICKKFLESQRD